MTLPRRGYLGAELPPDDRAFLDGALAIAVVLPGGMAAAADLMPGDRITSLAGIPLRDLCALAEALRRAGATPTTQLVTPRATHEVPTIPAPCERDVTYGELAVAGARLRTLTTGDTGRTGAHRARIVILAGIACESVETGPLADLAGALTAAGHATLRYDKRGVGDSEGGACRDVDFATEIADARAVIAIAPRDLPLVVFGHSVGGIIATQLAAQCDAVVVYGTPATRWLDCLRASTRRQLALRAAPPDVVAARVAALDELLLRGELNGRSAAYHAQLDALDLPAAWRAVECPALVVRGEHDWVVDADEQARIATLTHATIVDVPRVDHVLGAHASRDASLADYGAGAPDDGIARAIAAWLESTLAR
ncbi:MAG: alpha/beta fold hydrolase [Deltaproteobacteria bacterium]|nr:alpha/beta fold hydrolase [Deltaproteobacteria bacterium]